MRWPLATSKRAVTVSGKNRESSLIVPTGESQIQLAVVVTVGTTYKFSTWTQCNLGNGPGPYWIGAGDLNQDGKLDLAIALSTTSCGEVYSGENSSGAAVVYTGNGDGTFNLDKGPWLGGVDNSGIALGDFNRDGMIDMAVAGNAGWTGQDWVTIMQDNTQPVSISPLAMTYAAEAVGTSSAAQTVLVTKR